MELKKLGTRKLKELNEKVEASRTEKKNEITEV